MNWNRNFPVRIAPVNEPQWLPEVRAITNPARSRARITSLALSDGSRSVMRQA
jgi:hypothetical protein